MNFSILGTGSYVPPRVVSNDELATMMPTSDEWITQRVGVKERHICTTETAADLAIEASRRALENAGSSPEELDLILGATVSGDEICPGIACQVQRALGATCPAMDINAACSAFIYMLETAAAFFARGGKRRILVVGAERLSRLLEWNVAGVCVIFGDGAGAALLGPGEDFLACQLHSFGGDEVIDLIHDTGLEDIVLLFQQFCGGVPVRFVCGVHILPQNQLGQGEAVSGVVEGEDIASITLIPHHSPTGRGFFHHGAVVYQSHHANGVGDGVFVFRVKIEVFVLLIDVVVIAQFGEIQGL